MTISLDIFLDFFKEYYSHEYQQLSSEFKNHWIEEILLNNSKYITKQMVLENDYCSKCGKCCINQGCSYIDLDTKLCTIHDNPIDELCKTYPWTGEDLGIAPLSIECTYQKTFFIIYFNGFFDKCVRNGVKK